MRTLRLLPWLACSLALLALGVAPRNHVLVCMQRLGLTHPTAVESEVHCGCCEHAEPRSAAAAMPAPTDDPNDGGERAVASCPVGCCIDLRAEVEFGPLPRAELPDPPEVVATAPPPVATCVVAPAADARTWSFDTGPPRIDTRTLLRSSTVLHL